MINHLIIQQNKRNHKLTGFSDMYFDGTSSVIGCKGGKNSLRDDVKSIILPEFIYHETSTSILSEMTYTSNLHYVKISSD